MRIFTAGLVLFIVIGVTLLLFPAKLEAATLAVTTWQLSFADEFNASNDLVGWNSDPGDGSYRVDGGQFPPLSIKLGKHLPDGLAQ